MNGRFSTEEATAELLGPVGVEFDLQSPVEVAIELGGLASSAHAFVGQAVKCFLVGLDEAGRQLSNKGHEWLLRAIEGQEIPSPYFENATEAMRLRDLSTCRWLMSKEDGGSIRAAVGFWEKYLESQSVNQGEVALILVDYLDCGETELIRQHVAHFWKNRKVPFEVNSVLELCEKRSTGHLGASDVLHVIKRKGSEWLDKGLFDQFAKWVKLGTSDIPAGRMLREMRSKI